MDTVDVVVCAKEEWFGLWCIIVFRSDIITSTGLTSPERPIRRLWTMCWPDCFLTSPAVASSDPYRSSGMPHRSTGLREPAGLSTWTDRRRTRLPLAEVLTRLCRPARLRPCASARSRLVRPGDGGQSLTKVPGGVVKRACSPKPGGGELVAFVRGEAAAVEAVDRGTAFTAVGFLLPPCEYIHSPFWGADDRSCCRYEDAIGSKFCGSASPTSKTQRLNQASLTVSETELGRI